MPETSEQPEQQVHHHHHHHHRSSGTTTSSGQTYRAPSSSEYSLRSFGKRADSQKALPEGTLSIAVFSVLLTALLFAPVILTMFFRNKTLAETNFRLRDELGRLMQQVEEGTVSSVAPSATPVRPPSATRSRYVDESEPGTPQARLAEEAAAPSATPAPRTRYVDESEPDPPPPVRTRYVDKSAPNFAAPASPAPSAALSAAQSANEEAIAAAVGMTAEEIKALKRDMRLFPNGMRLAEDADGSRVFERDVLASNLQNAFKLLAIGQKRDAQAIFDMIAGAKPQWPFGQFYAALAGGDRERMAKAARLISTARAIGVMTPEGELYSAQAALFTKANASASASLTRVGLAPSDGTALQIGPVYAPSSAPPDILAKLRAIRGVAEVRTVDW